MAHKAEILAPCGSFETLEAALRSGCDAVYLGGEKFSARQNAANFTDEQLKEAVRLCHLRGVKVYQAINTVVFDEQLEECKKAVKFAAEIGVDGLITQDLALVKICRECCPDLEYHASTQMTIHSESGVKMAKKPRFFKSRPVKRTSRAYHKRPHRPWHRNRSLCARRTLYVRVRSVLYECSYRLTKRKPRPLRTSVQTSRTRG